jgi:RecA-family ATPase
MDDNILDEQYSMCQPPEPEPPPDKSNLLIAPPRKRWTVAELLDAEFPEPKWAIPDLIPEGLTIIGGRPKVGKSWLLLQAAIAVGTGGMFFNKRVEKGNVLYVAFEDGPRRLQDRIRKMGMPRDASVTFERVWKPMQNGGLDDLVAELAAVDYRLVIFDTLTRAFPGLSQKDRPEIIGSCIDNIQTIATNRNISITFSDHTRKPNGFDNDPIDDILYSSEKVKSADVVLALYKEQGKAGAKLLGRGRDIDEIDLALQWDPLLWCWQSEGNTGELARTERRAEILAAIETLGKSQIGDIAKAMGKNKGNIYGALQDLCNNGYIRRELIGKNVYYEKLQTP